MGRPGYWTFRQRERCLKGCNTRCSSKVSGVVNAPLGSIWARNIAHKHCAQGVRSVQRDGPEATDHITCAMISVTTMNVSKSLVRTFGSICAGHLYEVIRTYTKCTACSTEMIWSVLVYVAAKKRLQLCQHLVCSM